MSAAGKGMSSPSIIHIGSQHIVSVIIAAQEAAGYGFRNPLYRAALAGELQIFEVPPGLTDAPDMLHMSGPPTVIVLSDDGCSRTISGADAFPMARAILRWASHVMLHGAGGEASHYQMVVNQARQGWRVVLVETASANLPGWNALLALEDRHRAKTHLPPVAVVRVVPRNDKPHPIQAGEVMA